MATREVGIEYFLIVRKEPADSPKLEGVFPSMKEASEARKIYMDKNPEHYAKVESRTLFEEYKHEPIIWDDIPLEAPKPVAAKPAPGSW